jgi:hypothetical protein
MPARPAYFHRLADAITVLERLSCAWIDRQTLQDILGVSKTVAWRVLRQCGASQGPGNTLICERQQLVAALESLRTGEPCGRELRRRQRLEDRLTQLLTAARSQHIRVVPDSRALELVSTRFARCPPVSSSPLPGSPSSSSAPRIFWRSSEPWCSPCKTILRLLATSYGTKPNW